MLPLYYNVNNCACLYCSRFSLLLLEPAEIYFEDFSAFLFPHNANKHDFEKTKQIGRLKMCSKSIVFDPKDINKPLIKIPLKDCINISEWHGELATKYVVLIYTQIFLVYCIYSHNFISFLSNFINLKWARKKYADIITEYMSMVKQLGS
jgi:hypothetical protein